MDEHGKGIVVEHTTAAFVEGGLMVFAQLPESA